MFLACETTIILDTHVVECPCTACVLDYKTFCIRVDGTITVELYYYQPILLCTKMFLFYFCRVSLHSN